MDKEPKLVCAYIMTHDSGHAPNPFHGVCTLSICTPNHKPSRAQVGDWIVGLAGYPLRAKLKSLNVWRLVYAMHIDARLDLDSYYKDPRFELKHPKRGGPLIEACGDNFYRKNAAGNLEHTGETDQHLEDQPGTGLERQDIDGNTVFAGQTFWYFGRNAAALPRGVLWAEKLVTTFTAQPRGPRNIFDEGCDVDKRWSAADLAAFIAWLPKACGVLGLPIDWPVTGEDASGVISCGPKAKRVCANTTEACGLPARLPKKRAVCSVR